MTEACDSSGDEAPEEVTLSLSKSQATSRRKQERAIQAEQRLLVKVGNKKKRRENSQTLQEAATPATTLPESDGDELPDELIETLARNNQYVSGLCSSC